MIQEIHRLRQVIVTSDQESQKKRIPVIDKNKLTQMSDEQIKEYSRITPRKRTISRTYATCIRKRISR